MTNFGSKIMTGTNNSRIELKCDHHNGLMYVIPGENTWVCSESSRHVHALAGFLNDLGEIDDQRLYNLLQKWGLYYRQKDQTDP